MSLKGIEMQIAVPRTNEATQVQNQLNQKSSYDQSALADDMARRAERQKKQSAEVGASDFLNVKDEGGGTKQGRKGGGRRRTEQDAQQSTAAEPRHPYKGKHIDISL